MKPFTIFKNTPETFGKSIKSLTLMKVPLSNIVVNNYYALLASSVDLQSQSTSQLCLNCIQKFDSRCLPVTPHPYLLLEYNDNTI